MAPAHPHATGVAVYPALFQLNCLKPNDHLQMEDRTKVHLQLDVRN